MSKVDDRNTVLFAYLKSIDQLHRNVFLTC